ncbi:MAG: hypothetical protein PVG25_00795 [Anaerolineae bacterium]
MTELPTLPETLLGWLILTVSSTLQGAVDMGGGLVAVPLLALIDPGLVPGSALCAGLLLTSLMVIREHRAVEFLDIKWGIAARAAGWAHWRHTDCHDHPGSTQSPSDTAGPRDRPCHRRLDLTRHCAQCLWLGR